MPRTRIKGFSRILLASCLVIQIGGCTELDDRGERALLGGALGIGAGALLGAMTGSVLLGAVIGAGGGATIGALSNNAAIPEALAVK